MAKEDSASTLDLSVSPTSQASGEEKAVLPKAQGLGPVSQALGDTAQGATSLQYPTSLPTEWANIQSIQGSLQGSEGNSIAIPEGLI